MCQGDMLDQPVHVDADVSCKQGQSRQLLGQSPGGQPVWLHDLHIPACAAADHRVHAVVPQREEMEVVVELAIGYADELQAGKTPGDMEGMGGDHVLVVAGKLHRAFRGQTPDQRAVK